MRVASFLRRDFVEPGGLDFAVVPHSTHELVDGACRFCALRPSWPAIAVACQRRHHATRDERRKRGGRRRVR